MNNREAHFYLEELQRMMTQHRGIFSEEFVCANGMAIQALEKQEAKKPKHIEVLDGNWAKVCPTCRRVLMERITTDEISYPRHYNTTGYCWCGQKILWE